jgi:hypothetical protein
LFNPRKNKAYRLDDTEDPADSFGGPSSEPARPVVAPETKLLERTDVDLGTRVIEGFLCEGVRRTIPPRGVFPGMSRQHTETIEVETWASRELGQVLLETRRSEHETSALRLKNIRVGEPDESVFAILKQTPRRN